MVIQVVGALIEGLSYADYKRLHAHRSRTLAQFVADLKALASTTRKRRGNISIDAAVGDPQSGRLLISERWADQAALSAHWQAADTIAFVSRWSSRMRGELRKYDASNERDIMDC